MVEFTEREKMIIHSMNIMNNPTYAGVPFEMQTRALQCVLMVLGKEWNEAEMTDIMDAIGQESKFGNQQALKVLDKYGPILKQMKGFKI